MARLDVRITLSAVTLSHRYVYANDTMTLKASLNFSLFLHDGDFRAYSKSSSLSVIINVSILLTLFLAAQCIHSDPPVLRETCRLQQDGEYKPGMRENSK